MDTITVDRREWEQLTHDADQLMKNYQRMLGEKKALEDENHRLTERLAADEPQQLTRDTSLLMKNYEKLLDRVKGLEEENRGLKERIGNTHALDSEDMSTLKGLHSIVARVLKNLETTGN